MLRGRGRIRPLAAGFSAPQHSLHANNSYASATPATDARRLFVPRVEDGALIVTALDHEGRMSWEFNAGPFKSEHGLAHSPIVYDNLVLIADDQDLAGRVLALAAETGRLVWQAPLSTGGLTTRHRASCRRRASL